jgi:hypothetical protein
MEIYLQNAGEEQRTEIPTQYTAILQQWHLYSHLLASKPDTADKAAGTLRRAVRPRGFACISGGLQLAFQVKSNGMCLLLWLLSVVSTVQEAMKVRFRANAVLERKKGERA